MIEVDLIVQTTSLKQITLRKQLAFTYFNVILVSYKIADLHADIDIKMILYLNAEKHVK